VSDQGPSTILQQPSALCSSGGPAPRLSPLPSSKVSDQGPSTIPQQPSALSSSGGPAPQLSPPPSSKESYQERSFPPFGENHQPSATTFNGNTSCLTSTRSFAEVKHASLEHITQRRMIFHHLRLSAALKAFQSDTWVNRQQWWMQNLKFELVWTQPFTYQHLLTMRAGRITR